MIWNLVEEQILGMKWLNDLIGNVLEKMGLDISEKLGGSIQFFIYDVIKITILLCSLIYVISYIQSYFPPERSKKILERFKGIAANCIAALLGTVTPFCSCSSIPLFIGFTSAGLPLGVTFSFLISSPMVDLGSLFLLMSIFGTKVAVIYVIVGLIIAVVGGTLIEKLHMEKYVEGFILKANSVDIDSPTLSQKDRLMYAKEQAEKEKLQSGVKILGGGCAKCNQLEAATMEALIDLGMDSSIDHVKDYEKIAAYGVMTTPALVVDGKVMSYGKVLKKEEVIELIKKVRIM